MPFEDGDSSGYNSMQQQAGLLPAAIAVPPPVVFPGQITAMLAAGGPGAAMGILPSVSPFATSGFGGMAGYPGLSPMSARGPTPPSLFAPQPPPPPPFYAGPQQPGMFMPPPGPSAFNTPYGSMVERQFAAEQQDYARNFSYGGAAVRVGATAALGVVGAHYGGKYGGVAGAAFGGLAAMAGSEYFGAGNFAQNQFMEQFGAPAIQRQGFGAGIEHMSPKFIPFGPGPMGGFTGEQAQAAAGRITDMANSASFRRETFDRFNAADVATITQGAGNAGLLGGARDVEGMAGRVREVARSLTAFMELAQEPDIQRAIQSMGNLRATGLNLSETLGAVQSGRAFSRLAGTSFQEMLEVGGGAGASTFQAAGMSAGVGTRVGMANLGTSTMAQNAGLVNPALMSMLMGPQGLAARNNMFSANMLSMPMLAPAMMTSNGGLNIDALRSLINGGGNLFEMTGRGSTNLSNMSRQMGVEGLGMAVALQPLLRNEIGRALQSQGPFAQRNMEDTQTLALARQMNLRGASGFITAAQMAGASESEAVARAQLLGSPGYYEAQRSTAEGRRREARAAAAEQRSSAVGALDLIRTTAAGYAITGLEHMYHDLGRAGSRFTGGEEALGLRYSPSTDDALRRMDETTRSADFTQYMRERGNRRIPQNPGSLLRNAYLASSLTGGPSGPVHAIDTLPIAARFSNQQLRNALQDYVVGGEMSQELLFSGYADQRRAAENRGATFGADARGGRISTDFARRISSMEHLNVGGAGMALNAAFRAAPMALGLAGGFIDPGNLINPAARQGTDYRNALIEAVRANGGNEQQILAAFDRDPSQFMRQVAPTARLMMSPVRLQQVEESAVQSRRALYGNAGGLENFRQDQRAAMVSMMGERGGSSPGLASSLMGAFDESRGVGRRGSAKHERSRAAIVALAAVHATIGDNPQEEAKGKRQVEQILNQLRGERDGAGGPLFSETELVDIQNRAVSLQQSRFSAGEGLGAARETVYRSGNGADLINTLQTGEAAYRRATGGINLVNSMQYLRAAGGATAELSGGMDQGSYSQQKFEDTLTRLSGDEGYLRRLSGEGRFGRDLSQLLKRYSEGGERGRAALGDIQEILARQGAGAEALRSQIGGGLGRRALTTTANVVAAVNDFNPFSMLGRMLTGRSAIGSTRDDVTRYANESLDREVSEQLRATSEGERGAAREGLAASALQTAMRAAGIGGNNDQLLQAATELRAAATLFRDTISNGDLDRAIDRP